MPDVKIVRARIYVVQDHSGEYVHVVSTTSFYRAQIDWSTHIVSAYWVRKLEEFGANGFVVNFVPETVRFCLSRIIGSDCTVWSANRIHIWMAQKLGDEFSYARLVNAAKVKKTWPIPRVLMPYPVLLEFETIRSLMLLEQSADNPVDVPYCPDTGVFGSPHAIDL